MARDFNQNRVTNAKLGRETINKFGANFAINYGLDGFNIVYIQTSEAPSNIVEYFEGNDTYEIFGLPTNITKLCEYALASFPSITDLYLFTDSVIEIEDDLSYLTNLTAIYVSQDLLSAYQTRYANVPNILNKLGTVPVDYELTIPVFDNIGNVLNEQAINYFLSGISQQQKDACSKLIISTDYIDYYLGIWHFNFSEVFENLDNNIYYGNTKIDFTNYIIQGSGELTAGIVETQYNDISVDKEISDITKVTVPLSFISYVSGSINKIKQLFTDMAIITTTYDGGEMDIEIGGEIEQKIISIGKTLEEALIYARSFNFPYPTQEDNNLIILPPYVYPHNATNFCYNCGNLVYIPNFIFTANNNTFYLALFYCSNLIEANLFIQNATQSSNNLLLTSLQSLKRLKVIFNTNFVNDSTNIASNNPDLEQIILENFKNGNINLSSSNLLTRQALLDLINSLGTNTTQKTLTIGETNLAKLSADDVAIATAKNWVVQ